MGAHRSDGGRDWLQQDGPEQPEPPEQSPESYVWKMYQERCWEFFPAGDCFRKQYEDQLN